MRCARYLHLELERGALGTEDDGRVGEALAPDDAGLHHLSPGRLRDDRYQTVVGEIRRLEGFIHLPQGCPPFEVAGRQPVGEQGEVARRHPRQETVPHRRSINHQRPTCLSMAEQPRVT